jgi:hypothetical protein
MGLRSLWVAAAVLAATWNHVIRTNSSACAPKTLRQRTKFLAAIQQVEIDESSSEGEFEDESQLLL